MYDFFRKTKINIRFPQWKAKALTFSYDDGVNADKRLVEIFNKYSLKCTFNLNSGLIGIDNPHTKIHSRLTEDVVSKLYSSGGHEVAMHSLTHPHLEKTDLAGAAYQVLCDRMNLESLTGEIVRGFAYPYGTYNDSLVELLASLGVMYARTVKSTESFELPTDFLRLNPTCHHKNPKLGELAEKFVSTPADKLSGKDPYLFYVWGHSYEFDDSDNWNVIEEFVRKVSGKDDVWYATNIEIVEYIHAYQSLVFSANRSLVHNPASIDIYFEKSGEKMMIKSGETKKLTD